MKRRFRWLAVTALGVCLGVLLGCDLGGSPTESDGEVGFQTVLKGTVPTPPPVGVAEQEVIRDRATWQVVWTELHHGQGPSAPEIDFSREMVALTLGPGCCGAVEILSIVQRRSALEVSVLSRSRNALCVAADVSVHAVRLPRADSPARFDVRSVQEPCGSPG